MNQAHLPAARRTQAPPARLPTEAELQEARARREAGDGELILPRTTTPLDRGLVQARRYGLMAFAIFASVAHLAGLYARSTPIPGWVFVALVWIVAACAVGWRVRRSMRGDGVPLRLELSVGLVAIEAAYAVVQVSGERTSGLHPLVYLLAAFFAVSPLPQSGSLGLVAACVFQNVLRYACADELLTEWSSLAVQSGFTVVFALLYHLLLAARLRAAHSSESGAVARRLREAEESARSLRLIVADRSRDKRRAGDEAELAQRLLLGAVLEVERAVGSIIEAAHLVLGSHAIALYWLSDDDMQLMLRDGRCAAGLLAEGPLSAGDGLLGTVLRHGRPLRDNGRLGGINWYRRDVAVRAVCAVPVIERAVDGTGYVRGVLVVDRLEDEALSDRDESFLVEVAAQVARAVESERLVSELHRSKDAQDRLQRAAEELNRMATVADVSMSAVRLLSELLPGAELCAVTRASAEVDGRTHVVVAASGPRSSEVDGLEYDDNDGLVAHVVRLGAPMPARPPGVIERVKLFDLPLGGFGSLRVVPLAAGGRVLGTMVVGGKSRGLLDEEARRRLDSLSTLVAGTMARAVAFEEVEQLATEDGLTGLANRRQLDVLSQRCFQEAARYGRPVAMVVADVDHFKQVNDRHGHVVGDEVLKAVAATLREEARDVDVVGRYGGEEFVLVLPHTDAVGARELAERVRRRIESASIETSAGPIKVTISMGIAAYPSHGTTLEGLMQAGDEALYTAKRSGRNRVEIAGAPAASQVPTPNP